MHWEIELFRRLQIIDGAIKEIQSRPELSKEAKARGVASLTKARERLVANARRRHLVNLTW